MKLVITVQNITKVAESVLLNVYDTLDTGNPLVPLIEAELERRASILQDAKDKNQTKKLEESAKLAQLKSEVSAMFASLKQGRMAKLIEIFGDEFANDYELNESTFLVISHVAHRSPDFQTDRWEHETREQALIHLKDLLYDRIRYHHLRNGSIESLTKMKTILDGIQ